MFVTDVPDRAYGARRLSWGPDVVALVALVSLVLLAVTVGRLLVDRSARRCLGGASPRSGDGSTPDRSTRAQAVSRGRSRDTA